MSAQRMSCASIKLAKGLYCRASELLQKPPPQVSTALDAVPTPAPLPEAPASVNVRVVIGGREVQWTLRDTDEARLARYPVETPPATPALGQAAQPTPEGWCVRHAVQMKLHHGKDGRQWYSHQTAEGWCKGK